MSQIGKFHKCKAHKRENKMNKKTIGDIHNNGSVTVIQIEVNIDKDGIKASEKTNYDEGHKPKINESKLKRWSHWAFGKILAIGPSIINFVDSIYSKFS